MLIDTHKVCFYGELTVSKVKKIYYLVIEYGDVHVSSISQIDFVNIEEYGN